MREIRPLVSVIIPTYNVSHYIEKAIRSVLQQTISDFEIIIVDDCSTDNTIQKIKEIDDCRIQLYKNINNMGPSFSRNRAISIAKGKWLAILDSDDYWEIDRLEKMIEIANRYNVEIVCDDLYLIRDEEHHPFNTYLKSRESVIGIINQPTIISATRMIKDDYGFLKPLISTNFIKSKQIEYKQGLNYGEDFRYLVELLAEGATMIIIPNPMYYYRWNRSGSLTSNILNGTKQQIESTAEIIDLYSNKEDLKKALIYHRNKKKNGLTILEMEYWKEQRKFNKVITSFCKNPIVGKYLIIKILKKSLRKKTNQ